jgi:hypothetical protein
MEVAEFVAQGGIEYALRQCRGCQRKYRLASNLRSDSSDYPMV